MSARRNLTTSARQCCALGDARVASRVPRLAVKIPASAANNSSTSTAALPRRSINEAFSSLAGSTHYGFRASQSARITSSIQGLASRQFHSSASASDLKENIKQKALHEGKEFLKDTAKQTANREDVKESAKQASFSMSKILFGGLAVAGALYVVLNRKDTLKAEEAPEGPKYSKDNVTLLCLVGPHLSGKSVQAKRLLNRFDDKLDEIVEPKSVEELASILSSRASSESKNKRFVKRLPKDANKDQELQQYKQKSKDLEPLVKKYRDQGNIYEISADWDSEEEVWEQVEAKTEQILELREMGEL